MGSERTGADDEDRHGPEGRSGDGRADDRTTTTETTGEGGAGTAETVGESPTGSAGSAAGGRASTGTAGGPSTGTGTGTASGGIDLRLGGYALVVGTVTGVVTTPLPLLDFVFAGVGAAPVLRGTSRDDAVAGALAATVAGILGPLVFAGTFGAFTELITVLTAVIGSGIPEFPPVVFSLLDLVTSAALGAVSGVVGGTFFRRRR